MVVFEEWYEQIEHTCFPFETLKNLWTGDVFTKGLIFCHGDSPKTYKLCTFLTLVQCQFPHHGKKDLQEITRPDMCRKFRFLCAIANNYLF